MDSQVPKTNDLFTVIRHFTLELLTVVAVQLLHDIVHQLVAARDAAALSSSLVCLAACPSDADELLPPSSVHRSDDSLSNLSPVTHTHTHTRFYQVAISESRTPHLATKLNLATSHNLATPLSYTNFTSQRHKC